MNNRDDFSVFQTIKAGDEVFLSGRHESFNKCKIDRVTEKFIVIGGCKFRKESGSQTGNNIWNKYHIFPISEWRIAQRNELIRMNTIKSMRRDAKDMFITYFTHLTDEQMQGIYDLMLPIKEEQNEIRKAREARCI